MQRLPSLLSLCFLVTSVALSGCGTNSPWQPPVDAGSAFDAGSEGDGGPAGDAGSWTDAGVHDAGSVDAGSAPDAGETGPDGGSVDAGEDAGAEADAGSVDAGVEADAGRRHPDAGSEDAGMEPDAGPTDAGRRHPDAGSEDAGMEPDAGPTDAGRRHPDAGSGDAGSIDAGGTDGGTVVVCTGDSQCSTADYCAGSGCGTAGTCQPRPELCSDLVDPVCGCDGRTYINPCDAEQAGTRVASQGVCAASDGGSPDAGRPPPPDGGRPCTSNLQCATSVTPATLWCAGTGCGTAGECEPVPVTCTGIFDPVCGCDGNTYTNECEAEMAKVRVSATGSCPVVDAGPADAGLTCGAMTCGVGELCCEATSMCYAEGCTDCCAPPDAGSSDGGATCVPESDSQLCASEGVVCGQFSGVDNCGVDRFVHCDDCASGTCCEASSSCCLPGSIDCCFIAPQPDGGRGCTTDTECPATQYCSGIGCGTAGTCLTRPVDCPDAGEPVCGCDDVTYENSCLAEAAGVRAAASGSCGAIDAGMACNTNADCPSASVTAANYCAGSGCGTPGVCTPEPRTCSTLDQPVCGCNGTTYANSCLAAESGERVSYDGGCVADAGSPDSGVVTCGPGNRVCEPGQECCPFASVCYWPDAGFLCLPP
jgi:hypothetical protein